MIFGQYIGNNMLQININGIVVIVAYEEGNAIIDAVDAAMIDCEVDNDNQSGR